VTLPLPLLFSSSLNISNNHITGTVSNTLATAYITYLDLTHNLLTGNATAAVDHYGDEPFVYNCFDPAVPPSNPTC
jgi:hypothetical protein